MKKRIRKTGEIVDVIVYYNLMGAERDSNDSISYIDSKGEEHHHEKGLNLWWDFEDVEESSKSDIDWEQMKIKAAISALQGFASNPNSTSATDEELANLSIYINLKSIDFGRNLVGNKKRQTHRRGTAAKCYILSKH